MQTALPFSEDEVISSPWGKLLRRHVPEGALYQVCLYFRQWPSDLIVTEKRWSKYGDFRPGFGKKNPRITVNGDLSPFAFLITLVHEIAHHTCWLRHRDKVKPHGEEWKSEFRVLMAPLIRKKIFPDDVLSALYNYMKDPAASSCTDKNLIRALRNHESDKSIRLLEELPENAVFMLGRGKTFRKGPKKRKYYHCLNLQNNHLYLVDPLAEVVLVHEG